MKRLPTPERIGSIIVPDVAKQKGILGEVVAVGPGKWVPGEWWKVKNGAPGTTGINWPGGYEWRWFDGHYQPIGLRPGQKVYFNAKWNDFAGDYLSDLPVGHDPLLHLIQEGDIFLA